MKLFVSNTSESKEKTFTINTSRLKDDLGFGSTFVDTLIKRILFSEFRSYILVTKAAALCELERYVR